MKKFPRPESIEYIRKRTGADDDELSDQLAEALGDLPLALEQACAYIDECQKSLADYVRLLSEQQSELLDKYAPGEHEHSVAKTFCMAIDALCEKEQSAADLLNLCAFFAPDEIPLWAITKVANEEPEWIPEPLRSVAQDEVQFDSAVAALLRFSLVEKEGDFLFIHRLVQTVARERLNQNDQKKWAGAAVRVMAGVFPDDVKPSDVRYWNLVRLLAPHALTAVAAAEKMATELENVGDLCNQVGVYQWARAQYGETKNLFEKALAIYEKVLGADHTKVATLANNLGGVLKAQGDLAGAKKHIERALAIDEKVYGPDHPKVAIDVNNLGEVLREQGDMPSAKKKYERALKIWEKELGPEHPQVAIGVNNLGSVLKIMGDLNGAKVNFDRALEIDEKVYGHDHPNVAIDVNNLGGVLLQLGDIASAKECVERALRILEKSLGPEHPHTQLVQGNLERLGLGGEG